MRRPLAPLRVRELGINALVVGGRARPGKRADDEFPALAAQGLRLFGALHQVRDRVGELVRVADQDPHQVGVDSALWSCRLLADYLHGATGHAAGIETVRIALHRAGFVCKRPRWVLTRKAQAQPGWAKNA